MTEPLLSNDVKKVEPGKALDGLHSDDRMTVYSLAQVIAALLKPYKADAAGCAPPYGMGAW